VLPSNKARPLLSPKTDRQGRLARAPEANAAPARNYLETRSSQWRGAVKLFSLHLRGTDMSRVHGGTFGHANTFWLRVRLGKALTLCTHALPRPIPSTTNPTQLPTARLTLWFQLILGPDLKRWAD